MISALAGLLLLGAVASPLVPLVVDPHSVVPDPDGTEEKPFRTIASALKAAGDGATVELRTGLYTERVAIEKPVTLRGRKAAVVASPDATGTVIDLRAPARLEHLAVQGGEVGVEARDGARLLDVDFSAQRRSAISATGAVEVRGGKVSALFEARFLCGIEARFAKLSVAGTHFDGPFTWAIWGHASELSLRELLIEGAKAGVAFRDMSRGALAGSVLAQGRFVAVGVANDSSAELRDVLISRWDVGIGVEGGSRLTLEDSAVAFCQRVGIGGQDSALALRDLVHVGPTERAAVDIDGGTARLEGGVILKPGAAGIAVRRAKVEVSGTVVRGASHEVDGDGFTSLASEVDARALFVEECSGNGLTLFGGKAQVLGAEVWRVAGAGLRVEEGAQVKAEGLHVQASGTGLSVSGGGRVEPRFSRFEGEAIPGQLPPK